MNEEKAGRIYKVYEVTVKPFDLARIRDSYDCISIYNAAHDSDISEIIVICRPEDCPEGIVKRANAPFAVHHRMAEFVRDNYFLYYAWQVTVDGNGAYPLALKEKSLDGIGVISE